MRSRGRHVYLSNLYVGDGDVDILEADDFDFSVPQRLRRPLPVWLLLGVVSATLAMEAAMCGGDGGGGGRRR